MGALIVLGITAKDGEVAEISTGIYLAFLIIMLIGAVATWTILPLHKVIRGDGTAGKLPVLHRLSNVQTNTFIPFAFSFRSSKCHY
jgi:hypothetical protein